MPARRSAAKDGANVQMCELRMKDNQINNQ